MRQSITFEDKGYFLIDLDQLVGGRAVTFPLLIYLPLNQSMIPRFSVGEAPSADEIGRYQKKRLNHFACPDQFLDEWITYQAELRANESLTRYQKGNLDADQKKALLMGIGRDMVKLLGEMGGPDAAAKEAALKQVNKMTKDIVRTGLQTHKMKSVYEDLALLSEAHIEHSTAVSTIAVIFALTAGHVDEDDLAEIAMAGFLHDIGLALAPPALWETPVDKFSPAEMEIYHAHPEEGVRILEDMPDEVTELVRKAVLEHHERYDGGGFPRKLSGLDIDERVQVIAFADLVNDLMDGRITGESLTPTGALEYIRTLQISSTPQKVVATELFEAVYKVVKAGRP
jgi:response regulator RpfG family c-di-GMP phosphodiesterase